MQKTEKQPLILTLQIDEAGQAFFDKQRCKYFPPERNFLRSHLSLFYQLPDDLNTYSYLSALVQQPFMLKVTGLLFLGAGVAYRVESLELQNLHTRLSSNFYKKLIPQDRQSFRPHITIQNKVNPKVAKGLLKKLSQNFTPFTVPATGLALWRYLGGPWDLLGTFDFAD